MKNNTNIYDIDGEIIRKAGDNHKWTSDEVKEKIEYYRKKLNDIEETDSKAIKYATYMRNLSTYLMELYSKMTPEEFEKELKAAAINKTREEQIKEAMDDLAESIKNDTETEGNTGTEVQERSVTTDNESTTDKKSGNDEIIERRDSNIHEEQSASQDDLLVERDDINTSMDEYVQFTEE